MDDLAFIWAGLIAFAVLAYVLFDGFDLGIGILFPFLESEEDRDQAMNSVAPVWDGNETWLVLGGGGLMAAFPVAYAIVMHRALRAPHRHAAGLWSSAASPSSSAGARARQAAVGLGVRRRLDCSPPSPRALRSARSCRASPSPTAPTPAAGGTGSPPSAC